jgi:hypothetical protein
MTTSQVVKSTTLPLRSTQVVKNPATSLLRSSQVVYDVWVMTALKNNRRIAECPSLTEAREAIKPEHRKEYVYILKWTQTPYPTTPTTHPSKSDRFGPLQGQCPPSTSPSSLLRGRQAVYLWGCLCGRAHTNDMRDQVRVILRGD